MITIIPKSKALFPELEPIEGILPSGYFPFFLGFPFLLLSFQMKKINEPQHFWTDSQEDASSIATTLTCSSQSLIIIIFPTYPHNKYLLRCNYLPRVALVPGVRGNIIVKRKGSLKRFVSLVIITTRFSTFFKFSLSVQISFQFFVLTDLLYARLQRHQPITKNKIK